MRWKQFTRLACIGVLALLVASPALADEDFVAMKHSITFSPSHDEEREHISQVFAMCIPESLGAAMAFIDACTSYAREARTEFTVHYTETAPDDDHHKAAAGKVKVTVEIWNLTDGSMRALRRMQGKMADGMVELHKAFNVPHLDADEIIVVRVDPKRGEVHGGTEIIVEVEMRPEPDDGHDH